MILLLFTALPLALALNAARTRLREGEAEEYLRYLCGSIAAGIMALIPTFQTLFRLGERSSTESLIFLAAPVYSVMALGVGFWLGGFAARRAMPARGTHRADPVISARSRQLIWLPAGLLLVLVAGIVRYT